MSQTAAEIRHEERCNALWSATLPQLRRVAVSAGIAIRPHASKAEVIRALLTGGTYLGQAATATARHHAKKSLVK